jgi:hypothetical protein
MDVFLLMEDLVGVVGVCVNDSPEKFVKKVVNQAEDRLLHVEYFHLVNRNI